MNTEMLNTRNLSLKQGAVTNKSVVWGKLGPLLTSKLRETLVAHVHLKAEGEKDERTGEEVRLLAKFPKVPTSG